MAYKILCIGNSFSQDASHYVHQIAAADGVDLKIVNLYIGGCPLQKHWNNIQGDKADYDYELNGGEGSRKISISEALQEDSWDYITLQQVSGHSGIYASYQPFLQNIAAYVKKQCPDAELLIHQTWAYEKGSDHTDFPLYGCNQQEMHNSLKNAYNMAAKDLGGLRIIPCGEAFSIARQDSRFDTTMGDGNSYSLHRDGFHASFLYGRYLLSATWYECITGKPIADNSYSPDGADPAVLSFLKQAAHQAIQKG